MITAATDTTIALTDDDWAAAVAMANRRHGMAEGCGYLQTDGTHSKNGLANHIQGVGAEIATARLYELTWDATCNTFRRIPDLLCCEVRSTRPERPWLRIKMTDCPAKKSWPFISVTFLGNRTYRIEGWCYGYEGMKYEYLVTDEITGKPEWHVAFCDLHAPFILATTLHKLRELVSPGVGEIGSP